MAVTSDQSTLEQAICLITTLHYKEARTNWRWLQTTPSHSPDYSHSKPPIPLTPATPGYVLARRGLRKVMFGWVKILPHSEILDKIQATDFFLKKMPVKLFLLSLLKKLFKDCIYWRLKDSTWHRQWNTVKTHSFFLYYLITEISPQRAAYLCNSGDLPKHDLWSLRGFPV